MDWYASLKKPMLTPPKWVFGPVWTVLYCMIAISTYLLLSNKNCRPFCFVAGLYGIQLALNLIWTTLFFRLRRPLLAFLDILMMISLMILVLVRVYSMDRIVFYLNIPYFLWICFAAYLNFSIYLNN